MLISYAKRLKCRTHNNVDTVECINDVVQRTVMIPKCRLETVETRDYVKNNLKQRYHLSVRLRDASYPDFMIK